MVYNIGTNTIVIVMNGGSITPSGHEAPSILLEVCPSHPFYNPQLLVNATLDVEQVLNILSEFLVLGTPKD